MTLLRHGYSACGDGWAALGAAGWTNRIYHTVKKFSERPDLWDLWEEISFGDEEAVPKIGSQSSDEAHRMVLHPASRLIVGCERSTTHDIMHGFTL